MRDFDRQVFVVGPWWGLLFWSSCHPLDRPRRGRNKRITCKVLPQRQYIKPYQTWFRGMFILTFIWSLSSFLHWCFYWCLWLTTKMFNDDKRVCLGTYRIAQQILRFCGSVPAHQARVKVPEGVKPGGVNRLLCVPVGWFMFFLAIVARINRTESFSGPDFEILNTALCLFLFLSVLSQTRIRCSKKIRFGYCWPQHLPCRHRIVVVATGKLSEGRSEFHG